MRGNAGLWGGIMVSRVVWGLWGNVDRIRMMEPWVRRLGSWEAARVRETDRLLSPSPPQSTFGPHLFCVLVTTNIIAQSQHLKDDNKLRIEGLKTADHVATKRAAGRGAATDNISSFDFLLQQGVVGNSHNCHLYDTLQFPVIGEREW